MGASGKKAVKTVAEIKLYADKKTAEAPLKTDKTALSEIYAKCKKASGDYYNRAYLDYLLALGEAAKALSDDRSAQSVIDSKRSLQRSGAFGSSRRRQTLSWLNWTRISSR